MGNISIYRYITLVLYNPRDTLVNIMRRIASAVSRDFRAVYGPHYDLTVPEWRVLATLGEFQEWAPRRSAPWKSAAG